MANKTILVVDDEKDILSLLEYNLQKDGYRVVSAKSGEEGLEKCRAVKPDLMVLDLMLPGIDGLEVCRLLKSDKNCSEIPILMLTAKSTDIDQIVGLEMGASDYMAKPFSVKVLLARVKNILRSQIPPKVSSRVLKYGDLCIDKDSHRFTLKGKSVELTKLEFQILTVLMENPNRVFSREKLLEVAWKNETFIVDRTVDVHVKSIRKKLGKYRNLIQTIRGTGYRFGSEEEVD